MKYTLLATTALVGMAGAAAAELTISGTGRIGLMTTEGSAKVAAAATKYGKITTAIDNTYAVFGAAIVTGILASHTYNTSTVAVVLGTVAADLLLLNLKLLMVSLKKQERVLQVKRMRT